MDKKKLLKTIHTLLSSQRKKIVPCSNASKAKFRQHSFFIFYHNNNSYIFEKNDNFIKEEKDLIKKLCENYPIKFIHPETMDSMIIEFIKKSFIEEKEQSEQFINHLDKIINEPFIHIAPNFSIKLTDNINDFNIGPIKIIKSEMIKRLHPEISIKINLSNNILGYQVDEKGQWEFNLSEFCFIINIGCCPKQKSLLVKEYVNVGISLLRLYILKADCKLPHFPDDERNDPLPFDKTSSSQKILSFKPLNKEYPDVFSPPPARYYTIDNNTKIQLNNSRLNEMAEKILSPNLTRMQNRIYLALNWMSIARQQENLEEKCVSLFIALESLLTPPKKDNNPNSVTKKLQKYVSVILCHKKQDREKMEKYIAMYYDIRSTINHQGSTINYQGKEYLTQRKYSTLQDYVESIIFLVMEKCIDWEENTFFSSLEQGDENWNKEILKKPVEKEIHNPS